MKKSISFLLIISFVFSAQAVRISSASKPRISIITSVYDGDDFIEGFMYDITRQTIFDQCELIMIDANSPGHEYEVIKKYMDIYPNILYKRLDADPGLYEVWNMAIIMSQGIYVTNANLDDRLSPDTYAIHAQFLRRNPSADLVYSDFYITHFPNETFEVNRHEKVSMLPDFSKSNMRKTLPNNHPMWRKSMHAKYGLFDKKYKIVGDWEMWLRAVKGGATFIKVPGIYGLYYYNPKGLSTKKNDPLYERERQEVHRKYQDLFNSTYPEDSGK